MLTRGHLIVAVFIAAITISSVLTHEIASRRGETVRQNLAVAISSLQASQVRASIAERNAKAEKLRADSAERQVAMYEAVARRQQAKSAAAWEKFEEAVKANVCDSVCVNAARSAHLSDSIALAAKDSALAAEKVAAARYKLGLDQALIALEELREKSTKVVDVAKPLTKPPRRLSNLFPKLGVSATAGLDLQGKPNVVTGISLGYTF